MILPMSILVITEFKERFRDIYLCKQLGYIYICICIYHIHVYMHKYIWMALNMKHSGGTFIFLS